MSQQGEDHLYGYDEENIGKKTEQHDYIADIAADQNPNSFSARRRPYTPLDPTQFALLKKLRNAPDNPEQLSEGSAGLDRRLLFILANVQNSECLRCGMAGHRRTHMCPLQEKPLTTNGCFRCLKGLHSSLDCITAAISNCQAEKLIIAKSLPTTTAQTKVPKAET